MFKLLTTAQRPTLTCDAPGCKTTIHAADGLFSPHEEQAVKEALIQTAKHLGWAETPDRTLCPRHSPKEGK